MERIIFVDDCGLNPRIKVEIRDTMKSDTAQMTKVFHGAFLDTFKEDEGKNGVTLHFTYDYKSEDLSAL